MFSIESIELDSEIPTTSEILQLRGRIDTIFGNIMIEFKKDLSTGLDTAKKELYKYLLSYHEKYSKEYVGIATDGIEFKVFVPRFEDKVLIEIEEVNSINLKNSTPEKILDWFDAYFFTQDKVTPTSSHIIHTFGIRSPTFQSSIKKLEELFKKLESQDFRPALIKYDNWEKFIEIVFGSKPDKARELFFRHTYLSILVKFLIHVKFSGIQSTNSVPIHSIVYGDTFTNSGILNFIEEDFFSWPVSSVIRKQSNEIWEYLLKSIFIYDLDKIEEDVLKELYQDLITPEIRQNLGEFYTPDWLAEKMILETLSEDPTKSVMDPSCGSGTFLFKTIQYKKEQLLKKGWEKSKILEHIVNNVTGFDIHPLAIIIARTNYLLALQDLVHSKKQSITIPVYLSDSLRIPKKISDVAKSLESFEYAAVLNKNFYFPISLASDNSRFDKIIECMKNTSAQFALVFNKNKEYEKEDGKSRENNIKSAHTELSEVHFVRSLTGENIKTSKEELEILIENIKTLFDLIIKNADSIWPYVIRNMYKPISISHSKVDLLLGNPPWLALNKMSSLTYQDYVKKQSSKYGLNIKGKRSQISNLNIATLFFCQCVDNYLNDNGHIAFVMPESVLSASQYVNFLKFENPPMELDSVYELTDVSPLFRIPSCVLFAHKNSKTNYPIKMNIFKSKGDLDSKNERLEKAERKLIITNSEYTPVMRGEQISPYSKLVNQGASIIPHTFWFVDVVSPKGLGIDPQCPTIQKSYNPQAQPTWKDVPMSGRVEKQFFFTTLLSKNLVPFGYLKRSLMVLPVFVTNDKVTIVKESTQKELLGTQFSEYLSDAEDKWKKIAKEKSQSMSIYDRVNYDSNLTSQKPFSGYTVLYTKSATNIASCVIKNSEEIDFHANESTFSVKGFFAEGTTYFYNTSSNDEAYFLCSIFNSNVLNQKIKPQQSKGTLGPRDIHKIVFQFNIPIFDPKNESHVKLSNLGIQCNKKTSQIISNTKMKSIAKIREQVRNSMKSELDEIDKIVSNIFDENKNYLIKKED